MLCFALLVRRASSLPSSKDSGVWESLHRPSARMVPAGLADGRFWILG
jgi:hypothetical protein